jgi:drug/metabolite transporter (DMT)-like permease
MTSKTRKGMGGPMDLLHSLFVLLAAVYILQTAITGGSINGLVAITLGVILIVLEIAAILG